MASQVFVVKNTQYAKTSRLLGDPYHIANALDPQFFVTLIRRRKKNFNANAASDRRALTAEYQGSINSYVVGETSPGVIRTVIPMEDDREPESVSN